MFNPTKKQVKNILIIRTDRIGDVILSTPVIKNLRIAYPTAHISFICRPYTKGLLENNPYLDEVIVYDKYNKHKSMLATIKFAYELRKRRFDLAVILHPTNRAHLIAFLAAIPIRAGWNRKLSFLLTKKLKHTKQQGLKHELEYTLDILGLLGVKARKRDTFFPIQRSARKRVRELLRNGGVGDDRDIITIHPSASCPSKRWPQEHFIALIKLIQNEFDYPIMITTSSDEKAHAQAIIDQCQVIDLRGKLDIPELGVLIERSNLFISNDSGPVHIAASLNTPVISIFGRADPGLSPVRWKPLGHKCFYLHKDTGCKPCLAHNCQKEFRCLSAITPQEVYELSQKLLKSIY